MDADGYGISWNDELELEAEEIGKRERRLVPGLAEGMGMKLKIEFVQEEQR